MRAHKALIAAAAAVLLGLGILTYVILEVGYSGRKDIVTQQLSGCYRSQSDRADAVEALEGTIVKAADDLPGSTGAARAGIEAQLRLDLPVLADYTQRLDAQHISRLGLNHPAVILSSLGIKDSVRLLETIGLPVRVASGVLAQGVRSTFSCTKAFPPARFL